MTNTHRPWSVLRLTAPICVLALIGLGLGLVRLHAAWAGTPLPVADPVATAHRLDAETRTVYQALGLDLKGSSRFDPSNDDCYLRRGLSAILNNLSDEPALDQRAVAIRETSALTGQLTDGQALAALRHARQALADQGWTVDQWTDTGGPLAPPKAQAGPVAPTVVLFYGGLSGGLQIEASTGCARFPAGVPASGVGGPALPAPAAIPG